MAPPQRRYLCGEPERLKSGRTLAGHGFRCFGLPSVKPSMRGGRTVCNRRLHPRCEIGPKLHIPSVNLSEASPRSMLITQARHLISLKMNAHARPN